MAQDGKSNARIPYGECTPADSPGRRVLDLSEDGLECLPVLGMNKSVKTSEGSFFHRHRRCMEITLCVRGSVKFDCDGRVYSLLPGMIFASRPEDAHRLRQNAMGTKLFWIFFRLPPRGGTVLGLPADETGELVHKLTSFPERLFSSTDAVRRGFADLFAAYDGKGRSPAERCLRLRAAALALLVALGDAGHAAAPVPSYQSVQAVVERMRRHPELPLGTEEIARELRVSPSTALGVFRRMVGLPPYAFQLKCRIRRAEELLARSDKSISEIADSLGFSSAQHFATRFRLETGLTPRAWRKAMGRSSR